jgi:hypothetical protein
MIAVNCVINSSVLVCSFHFRALMLYSAKLAPSIHLHFIYFLLVPICFSAGCWAERMCGEGEGAAVAVLEFGEGEVLVGARGRWVGRWVVSRSWSEIR